MKYTIAILVALLVFNAAVINTEVSKRDAFVKQLEQTYKNEISILEEAILRSERGRVLLDHRLDSIRISNKNLLDRVTDLDGELANVKGRYKNHTTSELETEMIKRYHAGQAN
jgi:hypothetical protein